MGELTDVEMHEEFEANLRARAHLHRARFGRQSYRKVPNQELANRLNTSVDVLQHRAPKLGLRKYRPRRLPLSLQEIRDADRALKAGESLRSIARWLGTSHQVVNRAIRRWRSTHIRERAKARALELAREVPPLTTFHISDTVRQEFGLIGNGTFPTPKRIREWLKEAGLDTISRVGHSAPEPTPDADGHLV